MNNDEPALSVDRLNRRREHLMREITMTQHANPSRAPASPERQHPRRADWTRRGLVGGLVSAVAVSAVAVTISLSGPGGASAQAFSFERISSGKVAVHIVDTTVEADAMTEQLHEQGLNVTVDTYPASPQYVGTWLSVSFSDDVPDALQDAVIAQVPNGYTATVDLPTSFTGDIRFGIGRATKTGELPQVFGQRNALAPGARLGCLDATGGVPQDVQKKVEALGYTVSWSDGDPLDLVAVSQPTSAQRVVGAFIDDRTPKLVNLVAATPGTRRYEGRSRLGYNQTQWDNRNANSGSCTPA